MKGSTKKADCANAVANGVQAPARATMTSIKRLRIVFIATAALVLRFMACSFPLIGRRASMRCRNEV
jgi:hypothetical protein